MRIRVSDIIERVNQVIMRSDAEFKLAFSRARVSKNILARYCLRSLELSRQGDPHPELGGVLDDSDTLNLEHVIPQNESTDWDIPEQIAQQFRKRLGNMALLNPQVNVRVGNRKAEWQRKQTKKNPPKAE